MQSATPQLHAAPAGSHRPGLRERFRPTVRRLAATGLVVVAPLLCAQGASAADQGPLHAKLDGVFAFGACPAGAPSGALCLHDQVTGDMPHLGRVAGEFDVVIDAAEAGADGCAPISKRGSFVAANGDRLDVTGTGTFCFATAVARYTYTIAGGSGRFAHASGTGTWLVPAPSRFDGVAGEGDEFIDGTLSYEAGDMRRLVASERARAG